MTRPGIKPKSPGPSHWPVCRVFANVVVAIQKGAFWSPLTKAANLLTTFDKQVILIQNTSMKNKKLYSQV